MNTSARKRPFPLQRNVRQRMDGRALLAAIEDSTAACAFCDPQYRGVLDKLKFGNEGVRQSRRASLPQMSDSEIAWFVRECTRVVRPSGHVFLWVDKFTLGTGKQVRWTHLLPVEVVDMIFWGTLRFGMGKRSRAGTEVVLVLQKRPIRADAWTDHRIRDFWPEHADQTIHPHAKPHQLVERLIRAVTKKGDLVVDPCAGGYGVLTACQLSEREFLGSDLI